MFSNFVMTLNARINVLEHFYINFIESFIFLEVARRGSYSPPSPPKSVTTLITIVLYIYLAIKYQLVNLYFKFCICMSTLTSNHVHMLQDTYSVRVYSIYITVKKNGFITCSVSTVIE